MGQANLAEAFPTLPNMSEVENGTHFIDLLHMTPEQEQQLKGELQRSRGTIQAWVHPYFGEGRIESHQTEPELLAPTAEEDLSESERIMRDFAQRMHEKQMYYERGRSLLEVNAGRSQLPVVVFIEIDAMGSEQSLSLYKQLLQNIKAPHVYFVMTYATDPTPYDPNLSNGMIAGCPSPAVHDQSWGGLTSLLRKVGARKAIVSGERLIYWSKPVSELSEEESAYYRSHPELLEEDGKVRVPYGCVGMALKELDNTGIRVSLSKVTI